MDQVKDKVMNTKILGIVGAILTIIGVFLPFATVTASLFGYSASQSVSFIEGDGVFVLILSIIALVMIFANLIASKLNGGIANFFKKLINPKLTLIPTIISAIILIIDMSNADSVVGQTAGLATVSFGAGVWIMWIGLIATAAYPFVYKKAE